MFRPMEELIHVYFARTWLIATCENHLKGDYMLQDRVSIRSFRTSVP